ncbi:MAG: hypothetical protein HYZ11_18875 [Candidatus Tectomicrobia bacterium]|uniref:DUF5681 domain-containing protein n=1 Tax=Tectimicrobiota bacterium TaxID=2528274 RepID=A0A932I1L3_UNCTE|nr:hypothetical protein [Candidatus Tectomicrobia bacterium]
MPGAEAAEPGRTAPGRGYEVGYRKPPAASRFAKGRSGNPNGRPRKPKARRQRLSDAPSDGFLQEEAYRLITLLENGRTVELPAAQAVYRASIMLALKGNRLAQKQFLERLARIEEEHLRFKAERYADLKILKQKGEEALAEHRREGLPDPDLLPHPDDIVLDPESGEAFVDGPKSPEEKLHYDHLVLLRDHLLLWVARAEKTGKGFTVRHEGRTICGYLFCAQTYDAKLPRRCRWKEGEADALMRECLSLPRRELERRIASEFSRLKETTPRPSRLAQEVESRVEEMMRRRTKRRGNPPVPREDSQPLSPHA